MKAFVCTDHDYHYPVGVASVIIAENEDQARSLLDAQLRERGLSPHADEPYTLQTLSLDEPKALVLHDGNY